MGYYCNSFASDFHVKSENIPKIIKAYEGSFKDVRRCPDQDDQTYVDKIFTYFGLSVDFDRNRNIDSIWFEYGKLYSDLETFLCLIAPFVEDLSHIDMIGDDSNVWQYVFKDGQMTEYPGRMAFPGSPIS